jgi:hypothetical protein
MWPGRIRAALLVASVAACGGKTGSGSSGDAGTGNEAGLSNDGNPRVAMSDASACTAVPGGTCIIEGLLCPGQSVEQFSCGDGTYCCQVGAHAEASDSGPSDDGGSVDCVEAGGQCFLGPTSSCTGIVGPMMGYQMVCPGRDSPGAEFCCLPLNPGPPIEAGITPLAGPDASDPGDDGAACDLPAETCPGCIGGCVPVSCASQFSTPSCGADAGAGYCCLQWFNGGEAFIGGASDAGEADSILDFGFDCIEGVFGATTCRPPPAAIFNGPNAVGPLWVGCSYSYLHRSGGSGSYTCVAVDGGAAWEFDADSGSN